MFSDTELAFYSLGHLSYINKKSPIQELMNWYNDKEMSRAVGKAYRALGVTGIKGELSDFQFVVATDCPDKFYLLHVHPLTEKNKKDIERLLPVQCQDYRDHITILNHI